MVVINGTIKNSEIHFPRSYKSINQRTFNVKHINIGGKKLKHDVSDSDDE